MPGRGFFKHLSENLYNLCLFLFGTKKKIMDVLLKESPPLQFKQPYKKKLGVFSFVLLIINQEKDKFINLGQNPPNI